MCPAHSKLLPVPYFNAAFSAATPVLLCHELGVPRIRLKGKTIVQGAVARGPLEPHSKERDEQPLGVVSLEMTIKCDHLPFLR